MSKSIILCLVLFVIAMIFLFMGINAELQELYQ